MKRKGNDSSTSLSRCCVSESCVSCGFVVHSWLLTRWCASVDLSSSGVSRCSNLDGGWQPRGDSADSCSSTSGTSGTNMEDFFEHNTSDAVVGWQTDDSMTARKAQVRSLSAVRAGEEPGAKCTF